ncbi:hypothetical protein CPB84DRAFT_1728192 [Gymnopilus junonius]|uniref:Uncharacterized protein n=1 Tax=Gymnopilus junonius TaxID=109634 RepID=A0A9P5NU35_GYMJU|nr:hypothetical protein CPB84DRAFT_1728192 [Gymnopilus junonius]
MASTTFTIQASEHPIKSVTVFKSSRAEIVRSFNLALQRGQNKVEIRGLSSSIDTHSVRVSGLGQARLFDVVCTLAKSRAASYAPDSSSEVIRTLLVKKSELEGERTVREQESHLLLQYAKTLNGEHVTPSQMAQFLQSYVEQGRKIVQDISQLNEQIVQVTRQIEAERERTASKQGTASGNVDIVIFADAETSVDLKLTYIVSSVNWKPTYELHATTENGKPSPSVALHYRARVTQSTGEDWNNVSLTLSTITSDSFVKRIPQLRPVKIQQRPHNAAPFAFANQTKPAAVVSNFLSNQDQVVRSEGLFGAAGNNANVQRTQNGPQQKNLFGMPAQVPVQQAQPTFGQTSLFGQPAPNPPATFGGGAGPTSLFGSAPAAAPFGSTAGGVPPPEEDDEDDFEEIHGPAPITEPTTIVSETPVAVSFSVHGESTIPSDGIEHQVSVAVLPFKAKISYITIPRIDPRVFLQCEVENTSEYRILAGPVTVILDDSYVSKTSINDINTGDNFECTLGDDAATKVTYSRSGKTVKSDGGTFSEVTSTTTYTTKISVRNKHQFDITDLIVREVIPTSDDKRARIILRKPAALADAKDGETVDLKNDGLKVGWEPLVDGKGGEKEGKFEWKWKVGSAAKVALEAEWEIKVPADGATTWMEGFAAMKI